MNQDLTLPLKNPSVVDSTSDLSLNSRQLSHFKMRKLKSKLFSYACRGSAYLTIFVLLTLLVNVLWTGLSWLDFQFLSSFSSRLPSKAGIFAGIVGSTWLLVLTTLIAVPVGVGAGIYLEEIAKNTRMRRILDINIANLAGVPSIVYGILGLALFVRFLGLERSVLSASLTLSTLILPVIIIVTREALKAIPQSIRHAAFAVGATKWQTVYTHILPSAFPGILTGIILSVSRAIGETAPLILVGGLAYVAFTPEGPMDEFTALPLMIYNWAERPAAEFHELAAAGIIVLLAVLLTTNALAIYLRNRMGRKNLCRNL